MVKKLFLLLVGIASLGLAGRSYAAWNETSMGGFSESSSGSGANDTTPGSSTAYPASGVVDISTYNGGTALGTGSGSLGNSSDKDVYQFRITSGQYSAGNQVLKIVLTYNSNTNIWMDVNYWAAGGWAGTNSSGSGNIMYASLTSGNQDFYIDVQSGCSGCSFPVAYTLTISVVSSGTINGTVTALNATTSGNAGLNIMAYDSTGALVGTTQTDSAGAYSMYVPSGLSIVKLQAARYWYSSGGMPADWSYGPTDSVQTPFILSPSGSVSNKDFTAYPEATLSGTFSGVVGSLGFNIGDPYAGFNSGTNGTGLDTAGSVYTMHNVAPGSHLVTVTGDSSVAPVINKNIILTDGKQTTLNLPFSSGGSISGTISPAAYNVKIQVLLSGDDHGSQVAEADYGGLTITSWTVSKVPSNAGAGPYDIHVQNSGSGGNPSSYADTTNVSVGSSGVAVTGLTLSSTIQGTITDTVGVGSNLAVLAIRHADVAGSYEKVGGSAPISIGSVSGSGPYTYSVKVDPAADASGGYDLAVMDFSTNNGFPPIYASAISIPSGTTGQNFTTNTAGGWITGSLSVGGKSFGELGYFPNGSNMIFMFLATKLNGAGDLSGASYVSTNQLPAGSYSVKAKSNYITETVVSASVSNNVTTTANINATINTSKDVFKPYGHQLNPANGQTVSTSNPVVKATIGDGSLGSGVASISSATFNGSSASTTYSGGVVTVNHSTLTNGTYPVVVNFADANGNVGTVSWSFTVALATPTITPTHTNSPVATSTITQTSTRTPTITTTFTRSPTPAGTFTHTPTISQTFTITQTHTNSPTPSSTITGTFTRTATPTFTLTVTKTETKTTTPTVTKTSTRSPTVTPTPAGTSTNTPTISPTFTITQTHTFSPTVTNTPTHTATSTQTQTFTHSPTASPTPTQTETFTVSPTPAFASSGAVGGVVAGPVPAKAGDPICLYFDKMPGTTRWDIFNLAGDLVSTITYGSDVKQCWQTSGDVAGGVYLCRIAVTYGDGSTVTSWQKIAITK